MKNNELFEDINEYINPLYFSTIKLNSIVLTSLQKDVIVGTLLGDASMERDKPTHNPRIRFDQTYPGHEEYLY